jgi:parvulin-like peptidyl-prolyl isomerase
MRKNLNKIITFNHAALLLLTAIPLVSLKADLVEINRVMAKVEDRIVTRGEVDKAMDMLNFTKAEKDSRAKEFVDGKIDRLLAIRAFYEKGMIIPDSYLENEYNKHLIREFNGDRKLFRDILLSRNQSQLEFRKDLEEELIHGHMLSARRRSREEVSPDKVEQYYRENRVQFLTDAKIRLREIVFSQIAGEPEAVLLQQAQQVIDQIKVGVTFEELAKKHGQSPYKAKGGDWEVMVAKREIRNDAIREQAFSVDENQVTKPFSVELLERKADGTVGKSGKKAVYIIKVDKKIAAGVKPLDEVRQQIEKTLANQLESQSQRQWLSRLKRDAYLKYYFNDES